MKPVYAYLPLSFFGDLKPYNIEPINGSGMLIRACATKGGDGSILRSKEFLLFGNGLATLAARADYIRSHGIQGYAMELIQKTDDRGVGYWEIQSALTQCDRWLHWQFAVSEEPPSEEDIWLDCALPLVGKEGGPGQYIHLAYFDQMREFRAQQMWS